MADRPLKHHELHRILRRYGAWEEQGARHTLFKRSISGSIFTYPVPRHGNEVKQCYVRGVRKKFRLTASDGISDDEFYG